MLGFQRGSGVFVGILKGGLGLALELELERVDLGELEGVLEGRVLVELRVL